MNDFPTGISFDEARAIICDIASRHRIDHQATAISRTHGRVLAQDVFAAIDLPPFDNSAMDGFAFRHADLLASDGVFRMGGEQFAGMATAGSLDPRECARITTGAPLPPGADTVAVKERAVEQGSVVTLPTGMTHGANVRHAGEDVRVGDHLLRSGNVMTPARVSLAAAQGLPSLMVARRPTVAVFTSGDELIEPGMPLAPGQIYDSNRELLMGLLRADGLEPTAWPRLPDDPKQIEIALRDAGCAFDLIITCGAVSAGEKDHIPGVLARFGETHFWKVRMKPGMPLLFGSLDQARFLGLPGNPVSVLATYLTLGRTLIDGLQGRNEPRAAWFAQLASPVDKPHPRREFIRGHLVSDESGRLLVEPNPATGSHRLRVAAESNALIVIPDGARHLAAGDVVEVLRYT